MAQGTGVGAAVAAAYEVYDQTYLDLPTLPLAVVGAALGIFVSFRTNSAYDRWWEGRKLWGRMINESRHWASQIASYVQDDELRRRLVRVARAFLLKSAELAERRRAGDPVRKCAACAVEAVKSQLALGIEGPDAKRQRV